MNSLASIEMFRDTQISINGAIKEEERLFWLPEELICKIFSFLNDRDLDVCNLVCRQWRRVASDEEVRVTSYLRTRTFGADKWEVHYGNIGEKTPLPRDIREFLKKSSPFWPEKRVAATTQLVWMPKEVNGVPFTLNTVRKLIKHPLKGPATQFWYCNENIRAEHGTSTQPSGWMLMTNTVIPKSRGQSYAKQQKLVESHAGYMVPGVLEAATSMVTIFVMSGEYVYGQNPWTNTRCKEKMLGQYPAVVGDFGPDGLDISYSFSTSDGDGVGALWKF